MEIIFSTTEEIVRKNFLFYKPTPKQEKFHSVSGDAIERLFLAGNRTGKTYAGCIENSFDLTGIYPSWYKGYRYNFAPIICGICPSSKDARTIMQPLYFGGAINNYQGLIHPSLIKKTVYSRHGIIDYVDILHSSGQLSKLLFMSYEQGREKFQGKRFHKVHCDEEPPYEVYQELLIRLMNVGDGMGQGRMIVTMTPLYGMTPLISYYFHNISLVTNNAGKQEEEIRINPPEEVIKGKYYLHASWQDNPYLSEESKAHYISNLKPHEIETRVNGIPSLGEGMVYQIPESLFVVDYFEIPNHWPRFAGMDIGWEDPTAVVFFAYDREYDKVYVYKEYKVNHQTPQSHASSLIPMGLDWIVTVCDPAANQRGQTDGITALKKYEQAGIRLIAGKQAKESSIQEIIHRINSDRLKIMNNCRKTLDELRSYNRGKLGKILKGNDHLMNAMEYGILNGTRYAKTKVEYDARYTNNTVGSRF